MCYPLKCSNLTDSSVQLSSRRSHHSWLIFTSASFEPSAPRGWVRKLLLWRVDGSTKLRGGQAVTGDWNEFLRNDGKLRGPVLVDFQRLSASFSIRPNVYLVVPPNTRNGRNAGLLRCSIAWRLSAILLEGWLLLTGNMELTTFHAAFMSSHLLGKQQLLSVIPRR